MKSHNTRGLKEVAKERSMVRGTGGGNRSQSKPRRTKNTAKGGDEGVSMVHRPTLGGASVYGGPDMYPVPNSPGWFTSATPAHLQTDEDKYVIRWDLEPKSYFCRMTAIGPAFGASLTETPRFDSVLEAQRVINGFPMVAEVGSEIETVRGRLSPELSRDADWSAPTV